MNYEIINWKQGSEAWKRFRTNHVGASDAPVIMGISPWKNVNQLWREKLGLDGETQPNYAMRRGIDLENEARECFIETVGIHVKPVVLKSTSIPYLSASYDGVCENMKTAVEIKCPMNAEYGPNVPLYYYPQLQQQMFLLGIEEMYYFSWHPEHVKIVKQVIDHTYVENMLEKISDFWDKVLALEEPDMSFLDISDDPDKSEQMKIVYELQELKRNIDAKFEKEKEKLIQMNDFKSCKGNGIKLSSYLRKGSVEYSRIPEIKNIDLEQYRKPSSLCWKVGKE